MSDFIIYKHEVIRFINQAVQKNKKNSTLMFDISDNDSIKINEFLYCIVESCFLGNDFSKDAEKLRDKIKQIADCYIKKQVD